MAAEVRRVGLEREWLLRTLLVLQRPTTVFAALRRDDDEGAHARQEPITALVPLAGVAAVLGTSVPARLLHASQRDGLAGDVWAFVGGGVRGGVGYFARGGVGYPAAPA